MKVLSVILFLIFSVFLVFADEQMQDGNCPKVKPTQNFTETKFEGKWYDVKHFVNTLISGNCGSPQYTLTEDGYEVMTPMLNTTDGKPSNISFTLKNFTVGAEPGKYNMIVNGKQQNIPQYVLDTDYDTYGIVWGCARNNSIKKNIQRLFIYSRTKTISVDVLNKVNTTLTAAGIDFTKLKDVIQDDEKCGREENESEEKETEEEKESEENQSKENSAPLVSLYTVMGVIFIGIMVLCLS